MDLKPETGSAASLRTTLEGSGQVGDGARARDTLFSLVSHELRSPLNAIRLWACLLRAEAQPDAATIQKAVERIEDSVETQSRLINDLLDAVRIAFGRIELERERVDLGGLASEVLSELRAAAEKAGVATQLFCPAGALLVDGDRGRLQQTLATLVLHAIRSTPRGGHVELELRPSGAQVELQVKDDGAGIEEGRLAQVFQCFWESPGDATSRHGELGLGLHVAQHLAQRHGGSLTVHSPGPGRGTTFVLSLPRAGRPQGAPVEEAAGAAAAPSSTPGDVLVVDDEVGTAEVLAMALRTRGHEARVAFDGLSALDAIASHRPRLVVSDLMMPGMNGLDLIRRVREQEHDPRVERIPAIAITGRGSPSDRWRARRAGFDVYLTKPVQVQALFRSIDELLVNSAATEHAPLNILVLQGSDELVAHLRRAGHGVRSVNELAEVPRAMAQFQPSVLLIDVDAVAGDVRLGLRELRANHLSLMIVGLVQRATEPADGEPFDFVLEKPLQTEQLDRLLKQTQAV